MIFKSQQVNLDPFPYVDSDSRRYYLASGKPRPEEYKPRPEFEPTRDPYPMVGPGGNRYRYEPGRRGTWSPRREEFDTPVNRVLEAFREERAAGGINTDRIYWWLNWNAYDVEGATAEEREHARRVLTRLSRL